MEETIKRIINDSVLWSRVVGGMLTIINAHNNKGHEDFMPETEYFGITTALDLMGVKDEDDTTFDSIMNTYYKYKEQNITASEAAKGIFEEWKEVISNRSENAIKAA